MLAQSYPSKPVRVVVPLAPGGTTDIIARIVSERMGAALGQTVVVENKAGGGGIVGAAELVKAPPDGHVLGMPPSRRRPEPGDQPRTPYNPLSDFTPIINLAATPNVIAVHPSFGARLQTFLEVLKKSPPLQLRQFRHRRHRASADGALQEPRRCLVTTSRTAALAGAQ